MTPNGASSAAASMKADWSLGVLELEVRRKKKEVEFLYSSDSSSESLTGVEPVPVKDDIKFIRDCLDKDFYKFFRNVFWTHLSRFPG